MSWKLIRALWNDGQHLENLKEALNEILPTLEEEIAHEKFFHEEKLAELRLNAALLSQEITEEIQSLERKIKFKKGVTK